MIKHNDESGPKRESIEEAKVEACFMEFHKEDCVMSGQLEAMVDSCFFDESINELDVRIVFIEELYDVLLSTPCVEPSSSVQEAPLC